MDLTRKLKFYLKLHIFFKFKLISFSFYQYKNLDAGNYFRSKIMQIGWMQNLKFSNLAYFLWSLFFVFILFPNVYF